MRSTTVPCWLLSVSLLLLGGGLVGCDQVTRPSSTEAPRVTGLEVVPDSAGPSTPGVQVQDSVAQVPLQVSVQAVDPDGTVERVVFTFEPASFPQGAAFGELQATEGDRYAGEVAVGVPVDRDELYTIRTYAVDTDSLTSNQEIGRFRFVPEE